MQTRSPGTEPLTDRGTSYVSTSSLPDAPCLTAFSPFRRQTEYPDFKFNNVYNESCEYPQFWDSEGRPQAIPKEKGCMASDFDQYGDMEAFGIQFSPF